jgi:branched-chain amino acid transport system permease protein
MTAALRSELLERHRLHPGEAVYWLMALAIFFAVPSYLSLATHVLIMALFALSLDLILGFAGVVTLGHALFFGIGAYSAGLLALAGWHEAVTGALLAGLASAGAAAVVGPLILRLTGLPFLMVTLALGVIAYEAANKATWLTGGDDGLQGIALTPLFGLFPWSVYGKTGYLYSLGWLFFLSLTARRLMASPFGLALQGIRENSQRMTLIGAPVLWHLVRAYAISAFMAGIAGALSAQTTRFVGLEVLSLDNSADVMVMLVLGGVGRLYGGLVGAPVYIVVKNFSAEWNPYHWMFVIGGLLIFVVRFARGGILGMVDLAIRRAFAAPYGAAK